MHSVLCVLNRTQRGTSGRKETKRDVGGLGKGCSCEMVKMISSGIYAEGRADSISLRADTAYKNMNHSSNKGNL